MTKNDRLLKRFLENPEGFRFGKIEKILLKLGFELVSVDGSHWKYKS